MGPESWMDSCFGVNELLASVRAGSGVAVELVAWDALARERDEQGRNCLWYACKGSGKVGGAWRWAEAGHCAEGALGRVLAKWPGMGRVVASLTDHP